MTETTETRHPVAELYQGEVMGEELFNRMLEDLDPNDPEVAGQRLLVAAMLQLETETKARLRPEVVLRGLPVREDAAKRAEGDAVGASLAGMTWAEKMSRLAAGVGDEYLPRYRELAEQADPADAKVTALMVEHEQALLDAIQRAVDGDLAGAPDVLRPLLQHPLTAG